MLEHPFPNPLHPNNPRAINVFSHHQRGKFTNCPTPDSVLSTGSASIYSSLLIKSSSFMFPERLQIVKPIEGSQTLQHWQYLATPNLGCLFEERPGIRIKGNHEQQAATATAVNNNNNSSDLLVVDKKDRLMTTFNLNESDEGKFNLSKSLNI